MGNFVRITPFMHVADVDEAVWFFVDVLGFEAWVHRWDYAYVGVRILKASTSPGEEQGPGTPAFRYYIDVEDVAAVIAELRPKLAEH